MFPLDSGFESSLPARTACDEELFYLCVTLERSEGSRF